MDKLRIVLFVVLSAAIIITWPYVAKWIGLVPEPPAQQAAREEDGREDAEVPDGDQAEEEDEGAPDEGQPAAEPDDEGAEEPEDEEPAARDEEPGEADEQAPPTELPEDAFAADPDQQALNAVALGVSLPGSVEPDFREAYALGYRLHVVLDRRGAAVRRIELMDPRYRDLEELRHDREVPLRVVGSDDGGGDDEPPSLELWLAELEQLDDVYWRVEDADEVAAAVRNGDPLESISFVMPLEEFGIDLQVRRTYRIERGEPDGYGLRTEVTIENLGDEPRDVSYVLSGPHGLPLEGTWYSYEYRSVVAGFPGAGGETTLAGPVPALMVAEGEGPEWETEGPVYAGVTSQYFAAILMPLSEDDDRWIRETVPYVVGRTPRDPNHADVSVRLISTSSRLEAADGDEGGPDTLEHAYLLYVGPKQRDLLAAYKLGDVLHYPGFLCLPIGGISRILVDVLVFFEGIVANYGLAILLLTVAVRLLMFPLSRKQALSAVRMQKLQPEMKKLREKYKGDREKLGRAMMDLYKRHKINPLGGCLPILIQMPIFIGLYQALRLSVELRQSSFLWIDNLAAPDMLFEFPGFVQDFLGALASIPLIGGLFNLGPYFNLLPILTVVLFVMQQKMFMPPAVDDQTRTQQKIMTWVPILFGFFFYKVAAGLCLYFIASSLWGIGERKLLPKVTHAELSVAPAGPEGGAPPRRGRRPEGGRGGPRRPRSPARR